MPSSLTASVYFTDNFGETWYAAGGLGMGATLYPDKLNPNVIYATAGGSIYRSDNGGVSFAATGLTVSDNAELVPSAEKEGFLWIRSGTSLSYSEDAGKTMTYLKGVSANAIGVGKAEKDGGAMVLYFLGEANEQGGGVYMTADHGKHITKLSTDKDGFGNITYSITGDATTYGRFYFATNGRGIVMGDAAAK